eukprot:10280227-Karenia_brevis.AAC.1
MEDTLLSSHPWGYQTNQPNLWLCQSNLEESPHALSWRILSYQDTLEDTLLSKLWEDTFLSRLLEMFAFIMLDVFVRPRKQSSTLHHPFGALWIDSRL